MSIDLTLRIRIPEYIVLFVYTREIIDAPLFQKDVGRNLSCVLLNS